MLQYKTIAAYADKLLTANMSVKKFSETIQRLSKDSLVVPKTESRVDKRQQRLDEAVAVKNVLRPAGERNPQHFIPHIVAQLKEIYALCKEAHFIQNMPWLEYIKLFKDNQPLEIKGSFNGSKEEFQNLADDIYSLPDVRSVEINKTTEGKETEVTTQDQEDEYKKADELNLLEPVKSKTVATNGQQKEDEQQEEQVLSILITRLPREIFLGVVENLKQVDQKTLTKFGKKVLPKLIALIRKHFTLEGQNRVLPNEATYQ